MDQACTRISKSVPRVRTALKFTVCTYLLTCGPGNLSNPFPKRERATSSASQMAGEGATLQGVIL